MILICLYQFHKNDNYYVIIILNGHDIFILRLPDPYCRIQLYFSIHIDFELNLIISWPIKFLEFRGLFEIVIFGFTWSIMH